jgi:hypothetical protein
MTGAPLAVSFAVSVDGFTVVESMGSVNVTDGDGSRDMLLDPDAGENVLMRGGTSPIAIDTGADGADSAPDSRRAVTNQTCVVSPVKAESTYDVPVVVPVIALSR